jgi:hypothetical protein
MSSVVPMKLVPLSEMSNDSSSGSNNNKVDLPTLTTSSVVINDKVNNGMNSKLGDLSNLDKELLEILHNNDLTEDAKARLYWVSLHKAEIYKDKSMWTEPVIVELRENRFIPVPIRNGQQQSLTENANDDITFDRAGNTKTYSNKRKRTSDVLEVAGGEPTTDESGPLKRSKQDVINDLTAKAQIQPQLSQLQPPKILPTRERVATKRKLISDSEQERSDLMLQRMAKVNRIQANIPQQLFQDNVKIGEPLVVYDTQDQTTQPSTSTGGPLVTSTQAPSQQQQQQQQQQQSYINALPDWMLRFFPKLAKLPADTQEKIKRLLIDIHEKDPHFIIEDNEMRTKSQSTARKILSKSPLNFLQNFVSGVRKQTRQTIPVYNYLTSLGMLDQTGMGFKHIRKWSKI